MIIREAYPQEFEKIGQLMVSVYSQLDGFPSAEEQPSYYKTLANIGSFTENPETKLLVAISPENRIFGAVLYFGDMKHYGSGGTATKEVNASGIRLLAVDIDSRGLGVGKALTMACIERAIENNNSQVILHTTKAMLKAWKLYEKIGFIRSADLDFKQQEFPVFGFRLKLESI